MVHVFRRSCATSEAIKRAARKRPSWWDGDLMNLFYHEEAALAMATNEIAAAEQKGLRLLRHPKNRELRQYC